MVQSEGQLAIGREQGAEGIELRAQSIE